LGVVIYLLFFSGYLAVVDIRVNGQENIGADEIKKEITGQLEGKYGEIVSKNNLLLVKPGAWENILKEKFKKIEQVEIKRKFPSGLDVNISERKLALIFCVKEKCFILDDRGEVFEEIGRESAEFQNSDLPVLRDTSDREIVFNEKAIDPSRISFINNIKNKLKNELDIGLERELNTPNRISGDIRAVTSEGWNIFFGADVEAQKEVDMLKAVLGEKIPRETRGNLEYIDLRVENKVFYKFKEGAQEEMKPEEEKKAEEQPKVEGSSDKKKKKK
jgi:cell division septal protein FtsQ